MLPRPLHRWKSFWLGLLVLVFLGWAWARSVRHADGINYQPKSGSDCWSAYNELGKIQFVRRDMGGSTVAGHVEVISEPIPVSARKQMWPARPIEFNRIPLRVYGSTQVAIAHWFFILLFLAPWVGFLIWRMRRVKRFAAALPVS